MDKKEKTGVLNVRDLVNVGLFSVLIFIATIVNQETFKYSYGRNCTAGVENVRIKLPVKHNDDGIIFIDDEHTYSDEGYVPDWQFMEDYIKSLPYGDRL